MKKQDAYNLAQRLVDVTISIYDLYIELTNSYNDKELYKKNLENLKLELYKKKEEILFLFC